MISYETTEDKTVNSVWFISILISPAETPMTLVENKRL